MAVRSSDFDMWLGYQYFRETGGTASKDARSEAINACEGKALFEGQQHETYIRVARKGEALYIDMGNAD